MKCLLFNHLSVLYLLGISSSMPSFYGLLLVGLQQP